MAADRWSSPPGTPAVVSLSVLAAAVAVPLTLVGLATVTGWDVGRERVVEDYWFVLGLLAAGSLFSLPYGAVLGAATLPVAVTTDAGYGSPTDHGGLGRHGDHLAGAVLYAGLTTFAAGLFLWTAVWITPAANVQRLGSAPGVGALLAGGLLVAATFLGAQCYHHHGREEGVDGGTVAGYVLSAAGLLPSPFAALFLLDRLFPAVDLLDAVLALP